MGKFYDKRVWRDRLRRNQLELEPTCRKCRERGNYTIATHVDHIIPIEDGGAEYDPTNFQSLCLLCHTDKTNVDNGHVVKATFNADGYPIDSRHHWNKPT